MALMIESGTTAWWRNRYLLYMAMLLGFSGWFAYDAYIKYPAKNLAWAAQAMPERPADLEKRVDARVNKKNIQALESAAKGAVGFTVTQVAEQIGPPALVHTDPVKGEQHWFVGPACYVVATVRGGRLEEIKSVESKDYTASSILGQKLFALITLVAGLIFGLRLLSIIRTRVVLDEAGLRYNRTRIAWEEMSGLRAADYAGKGWLDIEFHRDGATRTFRLDSFHIARCDEIVTAICERKGFPSPLKPPATADSDETSPDASDHPV